MGYIKHHAIVVTSWNDESINLARNKAVEIFDPQMVSDIVEGVTNSQFSFFIGPDGSKEGWIDSNTGDIKRDSFIEWIHTIDYEDGSNSLAYAELFFGEDNGKAAIERHN